MCQERQITLSKSKGQVGKEVKFVKFIVSDKGTKPAPEKVAAIRGFPAPKNLTDLRSFTGLANPLTDFTPDLKIAMEPLKPLLQMKYDYEWTEDHDKALEEVKHILCCPTVLKCFNPDKPSGLLTDASRVGLGFVLIQPKVMPEGHDEDDLATPGLDSN